jgi:hypothetical protein
MKSRGKMSLVIFLLTAFYLAHAINSPSAGNSLIAQVSELQASSCPTCGTGYNVNFCPVNSFRLPDATVAKNAPTRH